MTKSQNAMYEAYKRATAVTLHDVYKSYSSAKFAAFHDCTRMFSNYDGYRPRIVNANGWMFTYAFQYEKDGKNMLCFITKSHTYHFEVEKVV